jgi:hypothetical protein
METSQLVNLLSVPLPCAILVQTVVSRVIGTVPVRHGTFLPLVLLLHVSPKFSLRSETSPSHRDLLSGSFH